MTPTRSFALACALALALAGAAVLGAGRAALADPSSVAPAIPPPVAPAIPPPPPAPKPAPELEQMKSLEGSWRCQGRAPSGPSGPEHAYKSSWKWKRDLDGFWWSAEYEQKRSGQNPSPMRTRGYLTWDAAARMFVLLGVDNVGGYAQESTAGWNGTVLTLAGESTTGGRRLPFREVITLGGPRELTWRGEIKQGGDWTTLGEDLCKK